MHSAFEGNAFPCVPALHSRSLTRRLRMNPVECSAGELFCPQLDTRFLVEYVRRDYAMLARIVRVNRHLKEIHFIALTFSLSCC